MEKEFGSWFRHQRTDWPSPNLNPSCGQNTVPDCMNPCANLESTNGNLPVFAFPEVPHSKASQPNEPRNWFYCLPRFRQAFAPVLNSVPRDELPIGPKEISTRPRPGPVLNAESSKRFLVFDQSGDQTTLVFSSGIGGPAQYLPAWSHRTHVGFDLNKEETGIKREKMYPSGPFLIYENIEENQKDDVESEMHEDTEELDALLYSDDEECDYSEDEEVTSTGHSPSTVTAYDKHERSEESREEEVASSGGPMKRQKLVDGGCYDVPLLLDTASSVKTRRCLEYEDDAESCCDDTRNRVLGDFLNGHKRVRKEKIRETISILQTIIPGGKGKDPIVALDDAIHYLRSLKAKAKALGLDTL